ncbi:hypothetical protein MTO96_002374 [Rhipicephalus appendiculatus]
MDFHTENSAPQVKKKSKLKPDHGSANQRLQANGSEQRDDGDCLSETDPSSTKHSVKEDVPKQTKKSKTPAKSKYRWQFETTDCYCFSIYGILLCGTTASQEKVEAPAYCQCG